MSQTSHQWEELRSLERRQSQMSGRSGASHYLDDDESSLAHSVVNARGTSAAGARAQSIMGYYEVDPSQVLERLRAASGGSFRARSEQSSATSGWKEQTIHEPLVESQRTLPKPKGSTGGGGGVFESRSVYDPTDLEEGRSVRGVSVSTSTFASPPAAYRIETIFGTTEPEYEAMSSPRFLQRSVLGSLHQAGSPSHLTPRRTIPAQYAITADQMEVVEPVDVRRSRSRDRSEDSLQEYVPLLEAPPSIPNTPTEQSEGDDPEDSEGMSGGTDDLMQLDIYTDEEKAEQRRAAKVASWQHAFGTLKWQQTDEEIQLRAKERAIARAEAINQAQATGAAAGGMPFQPSDTFNLSQISDSASPTTVGGSKSKKEKKDKKEKPPPAAEVEPPYNPANPAEYQEFLYFQATSTASSSFMRSAAIVRLPEPREMTAVLHDPLSTGTPIWDPFHDLRWWERGKYPDDVIRIAGVTSGHEDTDTGVPTYVDRFNNLTYGSYAIHPTRMWMVEYFSEKFPGHDHPILHTIDTILREHLDDVFALEKQLVDQFGRPQSYNACPPSLRFTVKYPSESKRKFKPLTAGTPVDIVQGGMRSAPKDKKDKGDKKDKSKNGAADESSAKKDKSGTVEAGKKDKKDKTIEKSDSAKEKTKEKSKEKAKEKTVEKKDKTDKTKDKSDKAEKSDKKDKGDKTKDKSDKSDKKDKSDKAEKSDKKDKTKDKSDKAEKSDKKDKDGKKDKTKDKSDKDKSDKKDKAKDKKAK